MKAKARATCERAGLSGRALTLKVKYADFQQITSSHTAEAAVRSAVELEQRALALLSPLFPARKGVRLLGVTLSTFDGVQAEDNQLDFLFSDERPPHD